MQKECTSSFCIDVLFKKRVFFNVELAPFYMLLKNKNNYKLLQTIMVIFIITTVIVTKKLLVVTLLISVLCIIAIKIEHIGNVR